MGTICTTPDEVDETKQEVTVTRSKSKL
jgi:hypothetical protein